MKKIGIKEEKQRRDNGRREREREGGVEMK